MDLRRVRYRQQLIEVFSVGQVHSSEAVAGLLHEPGRLEDAVAKASAESLTCPTPERECGGTVDHRVMSRTPTRLTLMPSDA